MTSEKIPKGAVHIPEQDLRPMPPSPNYALMLQRLVCDTSIPIERLHEAEAFIERQQKGERDALLLAALVRAQQDMEPIRRDLPNASTRSKYASLAAIDDAIRPHYSKHGLAATFDTRPSSKGELWITVVGDLVHVAGGVRPYNVDMLADGAGPKGAAVMTRVHAIGSAITYGKRQLLKPLAIGWRVFLQCLTGFLEGGNGLESLPDLL